MFGDGVGRHTKQVTRRKKRERPREKRNGGNEGGARSAGGRSTCVE